MTDHFLQSWLRESGKHNAPTWEVVEHGWEQHVLVDHVNNVVYRYPRNQNASDKLKDEIDVLKELNHISFNVSIPRILEHTNACTAYEYIPGDIITEEVSKSLNDNQATEIGYDLGEFLAILHSADPSIVSGKKTKQSISLFEYYTSRIDNAKNEPFYNHVNNLANQIKSTGTQVLMHGDLHGLNMIIDPISQNLTGVIDFSEVELGDRHQDFRKIFMTNKRFLEPAVNKYQELTQTNLSIDQIIAWAYINEWANIAFYKDNQNHPTYKRALKHLKKWGEL
jgi:aminoglycoside phosphotransferase (APT) family kinase protein